ncbi:MAG: hypothetical protein V1659_03320 [Candidatus Woesearchaeota archaeon]
MLYEKDQIIDWMQTYMHIGICYAKISDWFDGRVQWPGRDKVKEYATGCAQQWLDAIKVDFPEEIRCERKLNQIKLLEEFISRAEEL